MGCPKGVSEGTVVDLAKQEECYLSVRDLLNSLDSIDYLGTERDCRLRCVESDAFVTLGLLLC